nr:DUF2188 domain-containing protein [Agrilactobacillus fermenti]
MQLQLSLSISLKPLKYIMEVNNMPKNQWVSPTNSGWKVHGEGSTRATKNFTNKTQAIDFAKQIAKNQSSELIVQNKNGQIGMRFKKALHAANTIVS